MYICYFSYGGLSMLEKISLDEALLLSVARETQSHEFYALLANAMKDQEAAAKIRSLAEMEAVHRREAVRIYKTRTGKEPDVSGVKLDPYPKIPKDNANIYSVLDFAADKEKDAYSFYRELAKKAEDDKTRRLFLKFSDEEMEHCNWLTEEAAALRGQPGSKSIQESSGMEY
jgi:rubrerythrin